jgi:hypothetical protein
MHRNNRAALLLLLMCVSYCNQPIFWCLPRPRWTVVMCLARPSIGLWCPSVIACRFVRRVALFFPYYLRFYYLPSITHFPLMSRAHPTSSSCNFQLVFDNVLKAYKKRTKKDLLTHPLAHRLEGCHSVSSILTVLQEQVQELNESQRNKRFTKWLDPTVKVLHAFSRILRSLVSIRT